MRDDRGGLRPKQRAQLAILLLENTRPPTRLGQAYTGARFVGWLANRVDDEVFDSAFEELARRIRDEASQYGQGDVEAEIAHLRSIFSSRGGEDGPNTVGVREPRRPSPSAGSERVALEAPDGYEEAA